MAKSDRHIIGRTRFSVQLHSKQEAEIIQQALSDFAQKQLPQILDDLLSKAIPDNTALRIDRLEVDIGLIRLNHIEEDVRAAIARALKVQLNTSNEHVQKVPLTQKKLEWLRKFLKRGYFPWWQSASDSLSGIINDLVETAPGELAKIIWDSLQQERSSRRLLLQFSQADRKTLFQLLRKRGLLRPPLQTALLPEQQLSWAEIQEALLELNTQQQIEWLNALTQQEHYAQLLTQLPTPDLEKLLRALYRNEWPTIKEQIARWEKAYRSRHPKHKGQALIEQRLYQYAVQATLEQLVLSAPETQQQAWRWLEQDTVERLPTLTTSSKAAPHQKRKTKPLSGEQHFPTQKEKAHSASSPTEETTPSSGDRVSSTKKEKTTSTESSSESQPLASDNIPFADDGSSTESPSEGNPRVSVDDSIKDAEPPADSKPPEKATAFLSDEDLTRAFFHLLETGHLSRKTSVEQLTKWLSHWPKDHPIAFREQLYALSTPEESVAHIAHFFPEAVIEQVLHWLRADQAVSIQRWIKAFRQLPDWPAKHQYPVSQWRQSVLKVLLAQPDAKMEDPAFSYLVLQQLAQGDESIFEQLHRVAVSALSQKSLPPILKPGLERMAQTLSPQEEQTLTTDITALQSFFEQHPPQEIGEARLYQALLRKKGAMSEEEVSFFLQQLQQTPLATRSFAYHYGQHQRIQQHLVPRLSPTDWQATIQLLVGDYRTLIEAIETLWNELLQERQIEVTKAEQRFRQSVWQVIIAREDFDSGWFIQQLMPRLAQAARLSPADFLSRYSIKVQSRIRRGELPYFRLGQLLEEDVQEMIFPTDTTASATPKSSSLKGSPSLDQNARESASSPSILEQLHKQISSQENSTKTTDRIKAWAIYLRSGLVVAPLTEAAREDWEKVQLADLQEQAAFLPAFYRNLLRVNQVQTRLLQHFSTNLWQAISASVLGKNFRVIQALWEVLPANPPVSEKKRYQYLWRFFTGSTPASVSAQLTSYAFSLLQPYFTDDAPQLKAYIQSWPKHSPILRRISEQVFAEWKRRQRRKGPPKDQNSAQRRSEVPLDDILFVHNAGMVILAPFLPRYFKEVGLLEGRAFQSEEAAARACLLIQYLVSGRSQYPEHELMLNKILCGLELDTPLPQGIEVRQQEEEVAGMLLRSVLQNWPRMEKSTLENLRGSFLLRTGNLTEGTQSWQLEVEHQTFDVLLSMLPWTLSMVQLPWMLKRLDVTWKTNF